MEYHRPVLLDESIDWLNVQPEGVYVDLTYGGGGHSRKILEKLGQNGKLIAFDRDEDAIKQLEDDSRLILVPANYRHIKRYMRYLQNGGVDGILGDLGVSSHQFDEASRGFSYRMDAPLDMRMGQRSGTTAADIVNSYDERELTRMLRDYGEVRKAYRIASEIVRRRSGNPIRTTGDLVGLLKGFAGKSEWKFYSQVFQAIRIEVNEELTSLKEALASSLEVLKPGGRLVIISYHSLEDRIVKRFMKTGNFSGEVVKNEYGVVLTPWELPLRKPVEPSEEEIAVNSRARSARMRVAEKK